MRPYDPRARAPQRGAAILGLLSPLAVLVAAIALWALASHAGWIPRAYLPAPDAAARALLRGFASGGWAGLCADTVLRTAAGWALAGAVGIALGAAVGSSARLNAWLGPTLEALRPLPAPALLPLAVALWGLTPAMVLAVVAFGSLWPVLLGTAHGCASVDPRLADVRRLLGMTRTAYLTQVALPAALPDMLSGLRLALTLALIIATVGEMLASQPGIGYALLVAARAFRSDDLFAGVIVIGAIGFAGNAALAALERRSLRWRA